MSLSHPDRLTLAQEFAVAFREKRAPFFPIGNLDGWCAALNEVMVQGELDCAMHGAGYLHAAFPEAEYPRNMCELFARMPPADDLLLPFHDNYGDEVQIVPRAGSDTVILLFGGFPHLLGMPLCAVHRWLGRLPASLVYLGDPKVNYGIDGIAALAPNREATLAALRDIAASLGARRILCYGDSGGGFPALHYGLDLGAEAVLCFGAVTNISREFNSRLRHGRFILSMLDRMPQTRVDLCQLYGAAPRPPRVLLVYAEHNWDDRLHAGYLSSLPCVTLRQISNYAKHNITLELIRRGEYQSLLDWLVAA